MYLYSQHWGANIGFPGFVGHPVQQYLGISSSMRDPVSEDKVESYKGRIPTSSFCINKHAHMHTCSHTSRHVHTNMYTSIHPHKEIP